MKRLFIAAALATTLGLFTATSASAESTIISLGTITPFPSDSTVISLGTITPFPPTQPTFEERVAEAKALLAERVVHWR